MTMSPERFQALLDHSTADAPPAPPVVSDLEAGRSRLRRRQWTGTAAAALAVVVVAGGVGIATRGGAEDRGTDPIGPPSQSSAPTPEPEPVSVPPAPEDWTAARVLDACSDLPPGYFDGPETLVASTVTAFQVRAAVESADGRYWAECTIPVDDPDLATTVVPYDSQGAQVNGISHSLGAGCPQASLSGCRLYSLDDVDRLPPAVKAVQVDLADGSSVTVATTRGYYALNELRPLPDGVSFDDHGRLVGLDGLTFIHQLTYLDAAGTPLAAVALDGSGTGEFGMDVAGLPPASEAYPSLRGEF